MLSVLKGSKFMNFKLLLNLAFNWKRLFYVSHLQKVKCKESTKFNKRLDKRFPKYNNKVKIWVLFLFQTKISRYINLNINEFL